MCYDVLLTDKFKKDIQHYRKKKKFLKITDDIQDIIFKIQEGELVGNPISNLGFDDNDTYKVRAINSDMKVGKSNGYRVIYYVIKNDRLAYMLTIYSKKDDARIPSDSEIIEWINEYCN